MEALTPIYTADLFPAVHAELIGVLRSLDEGDWTRPTIAKPWRVRVSASTLFDGAPVTEIDGRTV